MQQQVNNEVDRRMQGIKRENGKMQLSQKLAERGLTPEQQQSFFQFTSTNPSEYGLDNVIKMWQTVSSDGTEQQANTNQHNPNDFVRATQQNPAQAGLATGERPVSKNEEDSVWEGIVAAQNRSNVL